LSSPKVLAVAAIVHVLHVDVVVLDIDDLVFLFLVPCALGVGAVDVAHTRQGGVVLDEARHVLLIICGLVDVVVGVQNALGFGRKALFDGKGTVLAIVLEIVIRNVDVQHIETIFAKLHGADLYLYIHR